MSIPDHERNLNLSGKSWLAFGIGPQRGAPGLSPLGKPLAEARLALVTTGGFVPPGGKPFRTDKLGDPTFREIPTDIEPESLQVFHPHYDHEPVKRDINVLFPLSLGHQLVDEGVIGELATTHYSFMGYVPVTRQLESTYAAQVAGRLKQQQVDATLLVPA
jgi:D-proline reductase (dithiol) PrdB